MKKGAYLVNTARGKVPFACQALMTRSLMRMLWLLQSTPAISRAMQVLALQQQRSRAGDVWFPQPAPKDHPWRSMPRHAMTPHYSGNTLEAQVRTLPVLLLYEPLTTTSGLMLRRATLQA